MLEAVLGDGRRRRRHFESALALNRQLGATHLGGPHAASSTRGCSSRVTPATIVAGGSAAARAAGLARELATLRRVRRARAWSAGGLRPDGLTAREVEILCLVARGRSNREIGAQLFISEHTAANHGGASCGRRAARTAPRWRRTRTAAGWSGRDAGRIADASVRDRAHLRRAARPRREDVSEIEEVNADEGVSWVFSFLSADRRRTYCLYEAPSPEAIVAAARGHRSWSTRSSR